MGKELQNVGLCVVAKLKKSVMAVLFMVLSMGALWAQLTPTHYDFSGSANGKTLYYRITNATTHEVAVTYPYNGGATSTNRYGSYTKPAGAIRIPDTVHGDNGLVFRITSIDDSAFYGCTLNGVFTMDSNIHSIGNYAFPSSVTSFRMLSFVPPVVKEYTFSGLTTSTSSSKTIQVPCGTTTAYQREWNQRWRPLELDSLNWHFNVNLTGFSAQLYDTLYAGVDSASVGMGTARVSTAASCTRVRTGTSVTYATISATPNHGYHFTHWSDGSYSNPRDVDQGYRDSNSYYAMFAINQYTLTAIPSDVDSLSHGHVYGSGSYNYNSYASVRAVPDSGYRFKRWVNNGSTEDHIDSVLVSKDTILIAEFTRNLNCSVCAFSSDETKGHAYINRTSDVTGRQQDTCLNFTIGQQAYLSVDSSYGYQFSHWSDNSTYRSRPVPIQGDANYFAYFIPDTFDVVLNVQNLNLHPTVDTTLQGSTMGSVTGDGSYAYLSQVTISAIPNYGFHFEKWSDNNTSNPRVLSIDGNKNLSAIFARDSFYINAVTATISSGTVSGSGNYAYLDTATLTATAAAGNQFRYWKYNGDSISNNRTLKVQTLAAATYEAIFGAGGHTVIVKTNNSVMGTVQNNRVADTVSYPYNALVSISAAAKHGYHFMRWSDGVNTYTSNPYSFRALRDTTTTFTAYFAKDTFLVSAVSENLTMGNVSTSVANVPYQETTTLTATSNYGYHFVSWNDAVTTNPRTITVVSDTSFVAHFVVDTFTVTANVANGHSSMGTVSPASSRAIYNSQVTLTVLPYTGYHFVRWNDNSTQNPRTVTVTGNVALTAYFAIDTFDVVAMSADANMGSVSITPNNTRFVYNSVVIMNATANYGYHFTGWNDGVTTANRRDTITGPSTFIALFEKNAYRISAASGNTTMGLVAMGSSETGVASVADTVDYQTMVTIRAIANYGYTFKKWSDNSTDNPRVITVESNTALTATFVKDTFNVAVISANANQGSVDIIGQNNGNGSADRPYMGSITIKATPIQPGNNFVRWSDGSTDSVRTFSVTCDSILVAYFESWHFDLTVLSADVVRGTVTGSGTYNYGASARIVATPTSSGYQFVRWNDGNTDNPRLITVSQDSTFTAYFDIRSYSVLALSDTTMGTVDITRNGVSLGTTANFLHANVAVIYAYPKPHYRFYTWTDGNTDNPRRVPITSDTVFTASFLGGDYFVTATANDTARGYVTGSGCYYTGSRVTLDAVANPGYRFLKWADNNSTSTPRIISVVNDTNLMAIFVQDSFSVSVTCNQSQGSVTGTGFYFYHDTTVISATANYGYHFLEWNDGVTENPRSIVISGNAQYTARFAANMYQVSATANNATMGTVTGSGSYAYHSLDTLSATPANNHYQFLSWSDGSVQNPRVITIEGDSTLVANFGPVYYTITVLSANGNMGQTQGGGLFPYDTTITITAIPDECHTFGAWNDANTNSTRSIHVTGDAVYTATFLVISYSVSVSSNNSTYGMVSPAGNQTVACGSTLTMTATPNAGYSFSQWSDGSTENPHTVSITSNANYQATFTPVTFSITVTSNDAQMGSASGTGIYSYGQSINISATPANSCYEFVRWGDGNTDNPRQITVMGNMAYSAIFAVKTFSVTVSSGEAERGYATIDNATHNNMYDCGDQLTLRANSFDNYHFDHWNDGNNNYGSNATISYTVSQNQSFVAHFAPNDYTITVNSSDPSYGTVTPSGVFQIAYGDTVTVEAIETSDGHFDGWNNGVKEARYTFVVTGPLTLTAQFSRRVGINDIDATEGNAFCYDHNIGIRNSEGQDIFVFDVMGRVIARQMNNAESLCVINVPASGVYMVKIGNQAPQKVVVVK